MECTEEMYTAVLEGNVMLEIPESNKATNTIHKKRKEGIKPVIIPPFWIQAMATTKCKRVTFANFDVVKTQIYIVNRDLPDELVNLLTEKHYW